jgi:hypothetical protein
VCECLSVMVYFVPVSVTVFVTKHSFFLGGIVYQCQCLSLFCV